VPGRTSIATALRSRGIVSVAGTVTVASTLLDASGRRTVIQDASAAVEVFLPKDAAPPPVGARVAVGGVMGVAYGAPRLSATSVQRLGAGEAPAPRLVTGVIDPGLVWRLVTAEGVVTARQRLGDRWRAHLDVGGTTIAIAGLAGAGIAADLIEKGSRIRVVGIELIPDGLQMACLQISGGQGRLAGSRRPGDPHHRPAGWSVERCEQRYPVDNRAHGRLRRLRESCGGAARLDHFILSFPGRSSHALRSAPKCSRALRTGSGTFGAFWAKRGYEWLTVRLRRTRQAT
jgi:hypothetical protein